MKIAVIGAGGFAREVEWLIYDIQKERALCETADALQFAGFVTSADLSPLRDVDAAAIGIGSPDVRLRLSAEIKSAFPHLFWPALIHPSVKYDERSCEFAEGAVICAGTILTVNVKIGAFAMINLSCTVGHETEIGTGTVINPLCAISGGVKIGKGCLIGTHSCILQDLQIGDRSVVGAGAMVHKHVPSDVTVMGVPAKPSESRANSALLPLASTSRQ